MKKLRYTLTEELALDGWEIEQLGPAIQQSLVSFRGESFSTEIRNNTYQGRAPQLWIYTFSKDEKDKKPGGFFEGKVGYRIPLMMFVHWQVGPQLRITARCYYEEAQPLFEHIVRELGAGHLLQPLIEPALGAPRADWFRYYHDCRARHGQGYFTSAQLAGKLGLAPSYTRRKYGEWKEENHIF